MQISWTCWSFCKEATYAQTFCSWSHAKTKQTLIQLGPSHSHTWLNMYPELGMGGSSSFLQVAPGDSPTTRVRLSRRLRRQDPRPPVAGGSVLRLPGVVWHEVLESPRDAKCNQNDAKCRHCRLLCSQTFQSPTFSGPSQRRVEEDI